MTPRDEFFLFGFFLALFFCVVCWAFHEQGFNSAIELCSSHPVECKTLYGKGDKQ
jgi:hypothetical protein